MAKQPLEVTEADQPAAPDIDRVPMSWQADALDEKQGAFWHSARLDLIGAALAEAQIEIEGAPKDAVNPHFKSKYADLASIREACRKPLAKVGIAVVQAPSTCGAVVEMTTMLIHKSGQFIASKLPMVAIDERPQSIGSTITYARRYALAAMTGVAPDDDDDGNQGSGRGNQPGAFVKPQPPENTRPIAPEIQPFLAAVDKDVSRIKEAFEHIEKEFVRRAGEKGLNIYNDLVTQFRERYPKGRVMPKQAIKDVILDMWEALQKIEPAPVYQGVSDDVPF